MKTPVPVFVLLLLAGVVHAEVASDFLVQFESEAKKTSAGFVASASRGEQFFKTIGTKDWSCSTCHTENPGAIGKHVTTGKFIDPLAPTANGERFTQVKKVNKWFKRNCNDVLGRHCSSEEKADFLAYLLSIGK